MAFWELEVKVGQMISAAEVCRAMKQIDYEWKVRKKEHSEY